MTVKRNRVEQYTAQMKGYPFIISYLYTDSITLFYPCVNIFGKNDLFDAKSVQKRSRRTLPAKNKSKDKEFILAFCNN